ncbi:LacI family DNA-binding transcriptional regulator [Actinokineospora sp. NBRC 105648]|uniref:LacI family DNA-binding transcriptional regulator n=1 Tax=Actinokineospora sp. NBRC 105648 TaxID=3032206 RepID=UPI0024A5A2EF|nr:LacI family DNA-binding transcriptional regulator [Actinokineospora sp. NBRC 105648]GLZ39041.1 LacI family transcriptional regulator [Actinokineospora sp. NBRC 105648]
MTPPDERVAPTLEEVARVAGVSRSTVSRVINDLPGVSKRARAAVEQAIGDLRYVPNQAARNLVTRRTNSIALVVSEHGDRVFGDPFFAKILRGVYAGMAGSRRQLVLLMAQEQDDQTLENYLCGGHVDGAVVVSLHGRDPLPARLVAAGLPVVLVGRPLAEVTVPYVDSDNLTGGLTAARHLLRTGRQRIATIAGPDDMAVGIDRLAGWRRGMAEADRRTDRVARSDFSVEGGAAAMAALLDAHPDTDAVFAAADIIAIGALRTLAERGLRVPEDIALVGFDDSVLATSTAPRLTTVRQDVEELGRTTTARLLAQVKGEGGLPASVLLPTELVIRDSA